MCLGRSFLRSLVRSMGGVFPQCILRVKRRGDEDDRAQVLKVQVRRVALLGCVQRIDRHERVADRLEDHQRRADHLAGHHVALVRAANQALGLGRGVNHPQFIVRRRVERLAVRGRQAVVLPAQFHDELRHAGLVVHGDQARRDGDDLLVVEGHAAVFNLDPPLAHRLTVAVNVVVEDLDVHRVAFDSGEDVGGVVLQVERLAIDHQVVLRAVALGLDHDHAGLAVVEHAVAVHISVLVQVVARVVAAGRAHLKLGVRAVVGVDVDQPFDVELRRLDLLHFLQGVDAPLCRGHPVGLGRLHGGGAGDLARAQRFAHDRRRRGGEADIHQLRLAVVRVGPEGVHVAAGMHGADRARVDAQQRVAFADAHRADRAARVVCKVIAQQLAVAAVDPVHDHRLVRRVHALRHRGRSAEQPRRRHRCCGAFPHWFTSRDVGHRLSPRWMLCVPVVHRPLHGRPVS